jgi:hypothetical protein
MRVQNLVVSVLLALSMALTMRTTASAGIFSSGRTASAAGSAGQGRRPLVRSRIVRRVAAAALLGAAAVAAAAAVRSHGDVTSAHHFISQAVTQLHAPESVFSLNGRGVSRIEHTSSALSFVQGHGRGCGTTVCRQLLRSVGVYDEQNIRVGRQAVSAATTALIENSAAAGGALAAAGAIGLGPRVRVARWRAAARAAARRQAGSAE